ncbi:hypothetical protein KSS87_009126 [Heliosperma pusillum]|nr:hypothetical protein KSS87_008303 [Heliosperma pusillum]KAH9613616.1 hypothetical protein KSS87_017890 [Heliosperma pusillum]KAH9616358.1 hypothetical protein KSS87_009126 [Heliosperma pusillum]
MMWLYWLEGFIHNLQCRQQISLRPPTNSLRILGNILNITRQNILDILLVLRMLPLSTISLFSTVFPLSSCFLFSSFPHFSCWDNLKPSAIPSAAATSLSTVGEECSLLGA